MAIIRPRLVDFFNIPVTQETVDFAIPFVDEDIPLYLDPFLLWKSPSQQDNALHSVLLNSFNHIGYLRKNGNIEEARNLLVQMSECCEAGLGTGKSKRGLKISSTVADNVLDLFVDVPQIHSNGLSHFEVIQLYVNNISKDRVSDIACNLLKSFLIDFTQNECKKYGIPMRTVNDIAVYSSKNSRIEIENVNLPYNPETNLPIILIPKRWLRFTPWINYEDYFKHSFVKQGEEDKLEKTKVLDYNRYNYDMVSVYVSSKERIQADCKNDPLFKQIPIVSAKKTYSSIAALPTGKDDNADKKYEDYCTRLLASLLYPHLDFAGEQSRTESGTLIRDLIFYNNCSYPLLNDIYKTYDSRQLVFEMKNVCELSRDHINQLNRYLTEQFGRFGVLVTRNPPKKPIRQNLVDLWSGQRKCIIGSYG